MFEKEVLKRPTRKSFNESLLKAENYFKRQNWGCFETLLIFTLKFRWKNSIFSQRSV